MSRQAVTNRSAVSSGAFQGSDTRIVQAASSPSPMAASTGDAPTLPEEHAAPAAQPAVA